MLALIEQERSPISPIGPARRRKLNHQPSHTHTFRAACRAADLLRRPEQLFWRLEPGARLALVCILREGEAAPPLRYGQKSGVEAKLRKSRNFGNPGAFDYAGYLARKDIYWTASTRAGARSGSASVCGSRWAALLFRLQRRALENWSSYTQANL